MGKKRASFVNTEGLRGRGGRMGWAGKTFNMTCVCAVRREVIIADVSRSDRMRRNNGMR